MDNSSNPLQPQEQGQISVFQLSLLVISVVASTIDIFFPSLIHQDAGPDSWISVIIATLATLVAIYMFLTLSLRYPDKTLIQYSCDILGKPLGKILGFIYIVHFLNIAIAINKDFSELYVTAFNEYAPELLYHIFMVLITAYAVALGLEVIARNNTILAIIGIGVLGLIVAINVPSLTLEYFRPILYHGLEPVIKGSVVVHGIMLDIVVALQFIPFVKNKEKRKIKKYVLITTFLLGISLELGVLAIGLFGPLTGLLVLPALEYTQLASLGVYLTNLEILILGIWIGGIFVKLSIFYYVIVLSIAQLFDLKSYRPMIVPVGIFIITFSTVLREQIGRFFYMLHYIDPVTGIIFGLMLPSILLVISLIRGRNKRASKAS